MQSTVLEEFAQILRSFETRQDLLVLHTACITNEVLEWDPKEGNWQLLIITEQFHHAKLASLFAGEKKSLLTALYSGFQLTLAAWVWKYLGNYVKVTTLQKSLFHCY